MEITIIAEVVSKEGTADKIESALKDLVVETHKEEGVVQYDMHKDNKNNNRFVMYEIWRKKEDLDAHLNSPHFKAFTTENENYIDSLELIYELSKY